MQRVRKEPVVKEKLPRRTTNGTKLSVLDSEELLKRTNPMALRRTAVFVCILAALGLGIVFLASMRLATMDMVKATIIPVLAVAICAGVALIMAFLPGYFIYKASPMSITVFPKLIEFRRQQNIVRVLNNENLSFTYERKKQKLRIYGDLLVLGSCDIDNAKEYRTGKVSLFIGREKLEEFAKAFPSSVKII